MSKDFDARLADAQNRAAQSRNAITTISPSEVAHVDCMLLLTGAIMTVGAMMASGRGLCQSLLTVAIPYGLVKLGLYLMED